MREAIIKGTPESGDDGSRLRESTSDRTAEVRPVDPVDEKLRPQRLSEVIGQRAVAERLSVSLAAAKKRGEPLPHILFDGPPGLGKTTFAMVLHNELGVELNITSGAALDKKMDVMPYLTNATEGSILFIDEIHRLPSAVEEFIYPVMEDFRVDVVLGEGMSARTINLHLKKFTIIGATTRSGMLSGPLRERFGIHEHLEFYEPEDLAGSSPSMPPSSDPRLCPKRPANWRREAGELPGSPTHDCDGSAITPWPAPTGTSASRLRATRSTCRKWTPRDSTNRTAAISRP